MKNILFVTTTTTAIQRYKTILDVSGNASHWAVSPREAFALRKFNDQPIQMILLNEKRNPNSYEKLILKQLCQNVTVHWSFHKKSNYWIKWFENNNLSVISHQEHSDRGTINDFFVFWDLEKTVEGKKNLFKKYFDLSSWHAQNLLKRKYLNDYTKDQLANLGLRLSNVEKIEHIELLLFNEFSEASEILARFQNIFTWEEEVYYRLKLAQVFYPSY